MLVVAEYDIRLNFPARMVAAKKSCSPYLAQFINLNIIRNILRHVLQEHTWELTLSLHGRRVAISSFTPFSLVQFRHYPIKQESWVQTVKHVGPKAAHPLLLVCVCIVREAVHDEVDRVRVEERRRHV